MVKIEVTFGEHRSLSFRKSEFSFAKPEFVFRNLEKSRLK